MKVVPQLGKKFPFYRARRFITALTWANHLPLPQDRSIHSMPSHLISSRTISTLFSQLCHVLTSGLFPSSLPTKTQLSPLLSPIHATCPTHLILNSIKVYLSILADLYLKLLFSYFHIQNILFLRTRQLSKELRKLNHDNKACFLPFMALLLRNKHSFHRQQCCVYLLTTMSVWLLGKSYISTDEV